MRFLQNTRGILFLVTLIVLAFALPVTSFGQGRGRGEGEEVLPVR